MIFYVVSVTQLNYQFTITNKDSRFVACRVFSWAINLHKVRRILILHLNHTYGFVRWFCGCILYKVRLFN